MVFSSSLFVYSSKCRLGNRHAAFEATFRCRASVNPLDIVPVLEASFVHSLANYLRVRGDVCVLKHLLAHCLRVRSEFCALAHLLPSCERLVLCTKTCTRSLSPC